MSKLAVVFAAVCLAASVSCGGAGSSGAGGDTSTAPSPYIDGFSPAPVADGYTRFITPVMKGLAAGSDTTYCQWVALPGDTDLDVLAVTGMQSKFGHHAILYASTENYPVGTSRECNDADMESVRFLGAIGGEGNSTGTKGILPPNVAFRLLKGEALMANIHFLNTGATTIQGQAVLDVQFAPTSPSRQIAQLFSNVGTTFTIPPHSHTAYDVSCPMGQDMSFYMFTDHMHAHGAAAMTEVIHSDGTKNTIVNDPSWTPDMQFNPSFVRFPQQFVVHKGDVIHTHCEWTGDSAKTLTFPGEMCVGTGFFQGSGTQVFCTDGAWPTH